MSNRVEVVVTVADQASRGLSSITGSLQGLGALAAGAAAAGLTAIAALILSVGMMALGTALDFQQATSAIIVGTGASGEALAGMEQVAKNLRGTSAGLGVDFGQLGATIAEVNTRTGATGETLEDFAGRVLNLSRLTGGDAVTNTRLITRVMGDWDVQLEDSAGLMDMLFAAGQQTGIGVDTLASKLVQFGAPLRAMGFSIAESTALLGKWELEGVNTELVLGSLRVAMGNFARDNVPMREGLEATIAAIVEMGPGAEATSLAMQVFGARAGPDMAAAILEGRFAIDELVEALEGSGGSLEDASTRALTFGDRLEIMKSKALLGIMPIGEALLGIAEHAMPLVDQAFAFFETNVVPAIQKVADVVTLFFGNIAAGVSPIGALDDAIMRIFGSEAADKFVEMADAAVAFKDRVVDLLAPVSRIIAEFVTWQDVVIALAIAIGVVVIPIIWGILSPILAVIAVAVALVAVIAVVRKVWTEDWGGIATFLTGVWDGTIKPALEALQQWLSVNIPIALDALAVYWETVLLPAIINVWTWVEGTLFPTLAVLWQWLADTLTRALAFLGNFWTNTLLPAITTVRAWVEGSLFPTLNTLWIWLKDTLTAALATLGNFWTNTLLPAITAVWDFIQNSVVPLFEALANVWIALVKLELEALQGIWQNVLLPAITLVWAFIQDNIIPIFRLLVETWIAQLKENLATLSDLWTNTLLPALTAIWEFISRHLGPVFESIAGKIGAATESIGGLSGIIQGVIGWLERLAARLSSISLPSWMTPGSPTPWELGLRGVSDAMSELNRVNLPGMQANFTTLNAGGPARMVGVGGGSNGGGNQTTIHIDARGAASGVDLALEDMVRRILKEEGRDADALVRMDR
jgi:phage-related minor tail protein